MTTGSQTPDEKVILAAGGILYRPAPAGGFEILVVHRKRYGDWTLPKGKLQPGESVTAAALREVEEESGCRVRLEGYLGSIGYAVDGVPKAILFWRMSLIEQHDLADHEEVAEVVWMPVAAAIQKLTHRDERDFLVRASDKNNRYKPPERVETQPPKGILRWFWPEKHDFARLQRESDAFRVDLALLEATSKNPDRSWAAAAHDQLNTVARYLQAKNKDVEGGWICLHAARRYAIQGLDEEDLPMQASMLRAEAAKFSSWRADEIKSLLSKEQPLTANRIANAMALRDEYFSNQYHKIWILGSQLSILLTMSGIGLFLLVPLVVFYSRHKDGTLAPWSYQMVTAVLFFGLLGAAFSAAGSLINAAADSRIPERVANQFVTTARALFGAGAGLAGYAFYQSRVLDVRVGDNVVPSGALAVAFVFGFAGEVLIAHVLGAFGARKS